MESLKKLVDAVLELYPGYYLRTYHNISEDNPEHKELCHIFCFNDHVDICDTRRLGELELTYISHCVISF